MRQQLEEIKQIDQYILHELSDEEKILMDARMILSPVLKKNWWHQLRIHKLIRSFGREQKRAQLNSMHDRLMKDPGFRQKMQSMFR
jgi:hypothetical protein